MFSLLFLWYLGNVRGQGGGRVQHNKCRQSGDDLSEITHGRLDPGTGHLFCNCIWIINTVMNLSAF